MLLFGILSKREILSGKQSATQRRESRKFWLKDSPADNDNHLYVESKFSAQLLLTDLGILLPLQRWLLLQWRLLMMSAHTHRCSANKPKSFSYSPSFPALCDQTAAGCGAFWKHHLATEPIGNMQKLPVCFIETNACNAVKSNMNLTWHSS